jgi:ornithine carbamoyltransferase
MPDSLNGQQVGLWFYGSGFRNRLAFEIGVQALGGRAAYIPGELGIHEPLEDIGHYLENWFSLLVIRAASHSDLTYVAAQTAIPVINARTSVGHPCEIMGDLQFIRRQRGSLKGLKVVFVGEVTNLGMSWLEAAVRFPIRVTQVAPEAYLASESLIELLNTGAKGAIGATPDLDGALVGCDVVYTDCFPKPSETVTRDEIRELFMPYQITGTHLARLKDTAIFLPCPPVTRGEEVSEDAMLSPLCLDYQAKAYLLHAQNAILELVAGKL